MDQGKSQKILRTFDNGFHIYLLRRCQSSVYKNISRWLLEGTAKKGSTYVVKKKIHFLRFRIIKNEIKICDLEPLDNAKNSSEQAELVVLFCWQLIGPSRVFKCI